MRKASAQGEKSKNDTRWLLKNNWWLYHQRVHLPLHWSELCLAIKSLFQASHKMDGNKKTTNACCWEQERTDIVALQKQKRGSLQVRANIFSIKSILVPMGKGSHGLSLWSTKLLSCWRVAFSLAVPVTYTAGGKGPEGGMQFWCWLSAWSWGLF